jgi:thiamine-phosphate pyrophosphorylase
LSNALNKDGVNRIIDANINRLKEGLRVTEEIARFILDSRALTAELKDVRQSVTRLAGRLPGGNRQLIKSRKAGEDIGRKIYGSELKRKGLPDILFANLQRAKESVRVLEEFTKLLDTKTAVKFKEIRYRIYTIEKKIASKAL